MLVDNSSRLQATKYFADEVMAGKTTEAAHRDQSPSSTRTTTETSRGHTLQVPDEPQQAAAPAVVTISDAVRAKVANWMRRAPVMDLITSIRLGFRLRRGSHCCTRKKAFSPAISELQTRLFSTLLSCHTRWCIPLWASQLSMKD